MQVTVVYVDSSGSEAENTYNGLEDEARHKNLMQNVDKRMAECLASPPASKRKPMHGLT